MRQPKGFSLLELVVSLAILAALATVAMRSANNLQSQTYYQVTTNSLNEIRNAIVGAPNQRGADGSVQITGFVADTGRLPNYAIGGDTAVPPDPFNELLKPNGIPAYGFVSSSSDPAVLIGAGWNGPYIRLGAGPSYIRDGWGNSFHVYDASGTPVTVAGNPIYQISSWGADNAADSNHGGTGDTSGYSADVSIPNAANLTTGGFVTSATVFGRISMNAGLDVAPSLNATFSSGPAPNQTYTAVPSGTPTTAPVSLWVCYFGPKPDGSVAEVPVKVADGSSILGDPTYWPTAVSNGFQFVLSGTAITTSLPNAVNAQVTVGPRVLRAYVLPAGTAAFNHAAVVSAYAVSLPTTVACTGGNQAVPTLVLPHYSQ